MLGRKLQEYEKKKALGKSVGPKKDEVSGQFMILHNEEFCGYYRSHSILG
jgi:hypothetical protein